MAFSFPPPDADTVGDVVSNLAKKAYDVLGSWASKGAGIVAITYVCGYQTLHRHATILGLPIGSDFSAADYLTAGTMFAAYCLTLLFAGLTLSIVLGAACLPLFLFGRWESMSVNTRVGGTRKFLLATVALAMIVVSGIVFLPSVSVSDVLLGGPPEQWISQSTLFLSDPLTNLQFVNLLSIPLVSLFLVTALWRLSAKDPWVKYGTLALAAVTVFQFLQLPAFYGTFVYKKSFARLAPASVVKLGNYSRAWLIWEAGDQYTFLTVSCPKGDKDPRRVPHLLVKQKSSLTDLVFEASDDLADLISRAHLARDKDPGCLCTTPITGIGNSAGSISTVDNGVTGKDKRKPKGKAEQKMKGISSTSRRDQRARSRSGSVSKTQKGGLK